MNIFLDIVNLSDQRGFEAQARLFGLHQIVNQFNEINIVNNRLNKKEASMTFRSQNKNTWLDIVIQVPNQNPKSKSDQSNSEC